MCDLTTYILVKAFEYTLTEFSLQESEENDEHRKNILFNYSDTSANEWPC
jgi:hypothetical protein